MRRSIYVGVDGGATKTKIRIEDESGYLLGETVSGPASIRNSVEQAWQSIYAGMKQLMTPLGLSLHDKELACHVGVGLAGCEIAEAYQAFLDYPHPFTTLLVSSDAHIACLGAHGGDEGAIIIIGTGVVGYEIQGSQTKKVGGWGFPYDDEGGGAWFGLEAIKITLQWLDGRLPASGLATAVYEHFQRDRERMINWANTANSAAYAQLAPLVLSQNDAGDDVAHRLIEAAALAIDRIGFALEAVQPDRGYPLSCALVGGIAPYLEKYLGERLRARLRPCRATPAVGAILMVRQYLTALVA